MQEAAIKMLVAITRCIIIHKYTLGVILTAALFLLTAQNIDALKAHRVNVDSVDYQGRKAVRVTPKDTSGAEDQLAILTGPVFRNGTIEVDLAGKPGIGNVEGARGFTGIAFRVASDLKKFECFYLRPTNGRADDQVRRNHSSQYISFPEFPWHRLRKEFPEKYESYVDLVPGEWTRVRILVDGATAKLYVHGNAQPTLIVNDLKHGDSQGAVALWVGPGTEAHFANLKITPR
jgi:hypothetical protein